MKNKKTISIDRFDNFSKDSNGVVAKKFYNYSPGKILDNTSGVKNAMFPKNATDKTENELNISSKGITSVEGIEYFKQYHPNNNVESYRLLIYGNDKRVYINQMLDDTWELFWLYSLEFNSAPITLKYKEEDLDAVILASEDTMKIWKTGYSPYTISDVPIITSMCMNEGVLFCSIKQPAFKLWYAKDLNASNIGNISNYSGYISLEDDLGDARKVVTFNEDVYVFRDYGISKIVQSKNQYASSMVYLSNTKIYANTVSVCGNNLLFMTKDGLYSFNGVKVTKTNVELLNMLSVENVGAVASSLGEKYYLALNINFDDDKQILCEPNCVNNAIIIVNTCDFTYEIIRGVDIKSMLPLKTEIFEKMLVVFNSGSVDKIGEICNTPKCMEENLPKLWCSDSIVDTTNTKMFTKLSVVADAGVMFSLKYDDKVVTFTSYKSGINEFMFKIYCKDVKIEISSNEDSAVVKKVSLDYYEY